MARAPGRHGRALPCRRIAGRRQRGLAARQGAAPIEAARCPCGDSGPRLEKEPPMRGTQAALVRHIGIAWTIVPVQVPPDGRRRPWPAIAKQISSNETNPP